MATRTEPIVVEEEKNGAHAILRSTYKCIYTSAHTSFGARMSLEAHMSAHGSFGAQTSLGAHTSSRTCAFLSRAYI